MNVSFKNAKHQTTLLSCEDYEILPLSESKNFNGKLITAFSKQNEIPLQSTDLKRLSVFTLHELDVVMKNVS